jgi:hypothetical protein
MLSRQFVETPMRKIVDSNFLRSPALRTYLEQSPNSQVVLTDYASMEAYKGNTLATIVPSMKILCEFPRQVILLKGTIDICALRGRPAGLQRRMIDSEQTKQFTNFCRLLPAAAVGKASLQRQLQILGDAANAQMDRVLSDANQMRLAIDDVAHAFTDDELRILRKGTVYTPDMHRKITEGITLLAASMFKRHPQVTRIPPSEEAPNTLIFRLALCSYLMVLHWIAMGGSKTARIEKIRNDMIDASFAAYATYFDGLLTADKKLAGLHRSASSALRTYFGAAIA